MNKKLLTLVMLSTPAIFGMDVWTKVKEWIIQNPSAERIEPAPVKPLPVLPAELHGTEIIKQLFNLSTTRDEALTLLSNYARVNKAVADYVKNNKAQLQKLLDEKFGLSLTALASGNYDDPKIKAESLQILKNAIEYFNANNITIKFQPAQTFINSLIRSIQNNDQLEPYELNNFMALLRTAIYKQQYPVSAVILGALDHFYTSNIAIFAGSDVRNNFFDAIKFNLKSFGSNPLVTQILKLAINKALKIYGPKLVNTSGVIESGGSNAPISKTLLEWAKFYGNKDAVKYFESIKKLQ